MHLSLSSGSVVAVAWLLVSCAQPVEEGSVELPKSTGPSAAGAGSFETDAATPLNIDANSVITLPAQSVVWKTLVEHLHTGTSLSAPSVGSRGEEAAVAYWGAGSDAGRLVVQRLDAQGERLGEAVAVASPTGGTTGPTLASDGQQYAVCWSDTQIHCSTLDAENQVHSAVLKLDGYSPKIVFGHGGWVLSYFTADEQIHLQALSDTLSVQGQPVTYTGSRWDLQAPLLVPTESGFTLVGPSKEQQAYLYRLGADLKPVAEPQPLGVNFWFFGDLAATDSRAAVSLSVPYGGVTLLLDGQGVHHQYALGGGVKEGVYAALTARDGGIASAWLTPNAELKTRFFADGAAESDLPAPTGDNGRGIDEGQREAEAACYKQFVQVGGRTLLVAVPVVDGRCGSALHVTTLAWR